MIVRYFTVLLLIAGCTPPVTTPAVDKGVASWQQGEIRLAELEERLPQARSPGCAAARRAGGSIDLLVPCYREIAEELVVERQILAEAGAPEDLQVVLAERLGGGRAEEIRFHAILEAYFRAAGEGLEIDEAELEDRYAKDPDRFRQPGSLTLWNLFRRHEAPSRVDETLDFLREVKRRVGAGEPFPALARELSHSETRLRDGLVGNVVEGRLPARLNAVAFALEDGEVSDPVEVRGGAVLLFVRNVVEGFELDFAAARGALARELRAELMEEAVVARIEGHELPPGSIRLEGESLFSVVAAGDPEALVLKIDPRSLTAEQLMKMVGISSGEDFGGLDEAGSEAKQHVVDVYEQQVTNARLYRDLQQADDELAKKIREEADEHVQQDAIQMLVDEEIRKEMSRRAEADELALSSYYEDNRHHYQTPLRFDLRLWLVPFGVDPPGQLEEMERISIRLEQGEIGLDDGVEVVGGSIVELGWRELDDLAEIPEKGRIYLLQVESGGYSVPYQHEEAIHLLHLVERQEPREMSFDEAAEQVLDDYVQRFRQRLARQVVDARLEAASFSVSEEAIRAQLAAGE